MARAIATDGTRPWRCPICDTEGRGTNCATARSLAQHITMTRNDAHKDWRKEHSISPVEPDTMKRHGVPKMIGQILQIINANPSLFGFSEG